MSYILIIGAKSDITKEVAYEYANARYDLYLAGREIGELERFKTDLNIRSQIDVKLFSNWSSIVDQSGIGSRGRITYCQ